jgi:hypothetical protein
MVVGAVALPEDNLLRQDKPISLVVGEGAAGHMFATDIQEFLVVIFLTLKLVRQEQVQHLSSKSEVV